MTKAQFSCVKLSDAEPPSKECQNLDTLHERGIRALTTAIALDARFRASLWNEGRSQPQTQALDASC